MGSMQGFDAQVQFVCSRHCLLMQNERHLPFWDCVTGERAADATLISPVSPRDGWSRKQAHSLTYFLLVRTCLFEFGQDGVELS